MNKTLPQAPPLLTLARGLYSPHRLRRVSGVVVMQVAVQAVGFAAGIVLVRELPTAQYALFALAMSLVALYGVLSDLGLASAVLAIGGPMHQQPGALDGLLQQARRLHLELALCVALLALPFFGLMLWRQGAGFWTAASLLLLALATAAWQVRAALTLSVLRLRGAVQGAQQLELALAVLRLLLLLLLGALFINAGLALAVQALAACAALYGLTRLLARHGLLAAPAAPAASRRQAQLHRAALAQHLWRQGPNTVFFVFNSQLALWLVSVLGPASGVANVAALGRLAGVFTLLSVLLATLVQPYVARQISAAPLRAALVLVNLFFALLCALLTGLAYLFPGPVLWLLGHAYSGLQMELVWMVLASTLAAWGGALYALGCARGWVLPVRWAVGSGLLSSVLAVWAFDVTTVLGVFQMNAATAAVGVLVVGFYVGTELRRLNHQPTP